MLSKKFTARSNLASASSLPSPDQALASFETTLRHYLLDRLSGTLVSSDEKAVPRDKTRNHLILRGLENVLRGSRREKFYFKYEEAHPVAAAHQDVSFHEALISMHDDKGRVISTAEILAALDDATLDPELGPMFRIWLIFAQINDFYSRREPEDRLSLNILPADTDFRFFREALSLGLWMTHRAGLNGIVLEAVENEPWTASRRRFLQDLHESCGVTLALDDYGAPGGYNQADTLESFKRGAATGSPLIVKLDGQIVRAFIEGRDTTVVDCLRDIRRIAPGATVVAEWISDAADARLFLSKLAAYGLENEVQLVQGRTLPSNLRVFLRDMARPGENEHPPLAPKPR